MIDPLPFLLPDYCIIQFTLYTGINVQTMLTSLKWMFRCSTEFADSVTLVLPSEFADSVTLVLLSEADAINGCMSQ